MRIPWMVPAHLGGPPHWLAVVPAMWHNGPPQPGRILQTDSLPGLPLWNVQHSLTPTFNIVQNPSTSFNILDISNMFIHVQHFSTSFNICQNLSTLPNILQYLSTFFSINIQKRKPIDWTHQALSGNRSETSHGFSLDENCYGWHDMLWPMSRWIPFF